MIAGLVIILMLHSRWDCQKGMIVAKHPLTLPLDLGRFGTSLYAKPWQEEYFVFSSFVNSYPPLTPLSALPSIIYYCHSDPLVAHKVPLLQ